MKKIVLLGAAPVAGAMRYPSEGSIEVAPDEADDLIKVGLAKADDINSLKVDELHKVAAVEGVNIGPAAVKDDLATAIRDRRQNRA
jgi:hypothetical protein